MFYKMTLVKLVFKSPYVWWEISSLGNYGFILFSSVIHMSLNNWDWYLTITEKKEKLEI